MGGGGGGGAEEKEMNKILCLLHVHVVAYSFIYI